MAEEQRVPAAEQPPTSVVETPAPAPITKESIKEMRKNRDIDGIRKVGDPKPSDVPLAPSAVPDAPKPPETEAKDRKFNVKYQGRTILRDDPDHMLGLGNLPAVKRKLIMAEEEAKLIQGDLEDARKFGFSTAAERDELKKRLAENEKLIEDLKKQSVKPAEPAPAAAVAPVAPVVDDIEIPNLPDGDPVNWSAEHGTAIKKTLVALHEQNKKLNQAFAQMKAQPAAVQATPEFKAELDSIKKELAEQKQKNEQLYAAAQKANSDVAESAFWNQYSEFQTLHDDLGTPKPLKDVHQDVDRWMIKLAAANGHRMPIGGTQEQMKAFDNMKRSIAARYLEGDEAIVKQSDGIEPPDGHKAYFAIAELDQKRRQLIADGYLGNKTTLEDAFRFDLMRNGSLDEATARMESDKIKQGVRATLDAIKSSGDFAKPLPNNAGSDSAVPVKLESGDRDNILQMARTPRGLREIMGNPDLTKKYEMVMAQLAAPKQ
jgi:hypothetical protein